MVAHAPGPPSDHRQRAWATWCGGSDGAPAERGAPTMTWQRQLFTALGCALLGVLVRLAPFVPVQLATVGLAIGVIGAAFLLGWAADAGEAVFQGGFVIATVALATVLPEIIIEVRFAFTQQVALVTANLTGATRLLLTGAVAMPLAVAYLAYRRGEAGGALQPPPAPRVGVRVPLVRSVRAGPNVLP